MAYAISTYMHGYEWLAKLVTVAILSGFSSVILVMLLGQSRVFYSMSERRAGAEGLLRTSIRRYQTPWKSNMHLLLLHGALRRVRAGKRRRRDDQHRHALRVHPGVRRRVDHARPASRRAARLHRARASGGGGARHRRLRRDDLRSRLDQLGPAGGMAGHRTRVLLQPTGARTAAWRSREAAASR